MATATRAGRRVPLAQLPDTCPHCQGSLVDTGTTDQFQTDIPRTPLVRKFRVHIGHCEACGKRTQGRHPRQSFAHPRKSVIVGPKPKRAVL